MSNWVEAPGAMPGGLVPFTMGDAFADLLHHAGMERVTYQTGYSIDDQCGELSKGELCFVLARSGCGKSTWYLNVIAHSPEVPTVVFNMEMTARRQFEWLLGMSFPLVTPAKEIDGVLRWGADDPRYNELVAAGEQMHQRYPNVHIFQPNRPTVGALMACIQDVEDSTGVRPERVFIDHLTLMSGTEEGYSGVMKTTSGLHAMAMKEELAVYCLQQTPRGSPDGKGRNDGHLPLTVSSGVFGGEQDADWIYGLYRPERDPKFKKSKYMLNGPEYFQLLADLEVVRGITVFQCLKNRPFGDLCEEGIELVYDPHTRKLNEKGVFA